MKKIILLLVITMLLFASCISMVPERKLREWAYTHNFIMKSECPTLVVPEREAQPHPIIPTIIIKDENGESIELTQAFLMETIIMLFGTVEKYQVLVEIYEREYLNKDGEIMKDLSLEELKELYKSRLSSIEKLDTNKDEFPALGAIANEMTIQQFEVIVEAWNYFQGVKEWKK